VHQRVRNLVPFRDSLALSAAHHAWENGRCEEFVRRSAVVRDP
jgi:hypothetical protein